MTYFCWIVGAFLFMDSLHAAPQTFHQIRHHKKHEEKTEEVYTSPGTHSSYVQPPHAFSQQSHHGQQQYGSTHLGQEQLYEQAWKQPDMFNEQFDTFHEPSVKKPPGVVYSSYYSSYNPSIPKMFQEQTKGHIYRSIDQHQVEDLDDRESNYNKELVELISNTKPITANTKSSSSSSSTGYVSGFTGSSSTSSSANGSPKYMKLVYNPQELKPIVNSGKVESISSQDSNVFGKLVSNMFETQRENGKIQPTIFYSEQNIYDQQNGSGLDQKQLSLPSHTTLTGPQGTGGGSSSSWSSWSSWSSYPAVPVMMNRRVESIPLENHKPYGVSHTSISGRDGDSNNYKKEHNIFESQTHTKEIKSKLENQHNFAKPVDVQQPGQTWERPTSYVEIPSSIDQPSDSSGTAWTSRSYFEKSSNVDHHPTNTGSDSLLTTGVYTIQQHPVDTKKQMESASLKRYDSFTSSEKEIGFEPKTTTEKVVTSFQRGTHERKEHISHYVNGQHPEPQLFSVRSNDDISNKPSFVKTHNVNGFEKINDQMTTDTSGVQPYNRLITNSSVVKHQVLTQQEDVNNRNIPKIEYEFQRQYLKPNDNMGFDTIQEHKKIISYNLPEMTPNHEMKPTLHTITKERIFEEPSTGTNEGFGSYGNVYESFDAQKSKDNRSSLSPIQNTAGSAITFRKESRNSTELYETKVHGFGGNDNIPIQPVQKTSAVPISPDSVNYEQFGEDFMQRQFGSEKNLERLEKMRTRPYFNEGAFERNIYRADTVRRDFDSAHNIEDKTGHGKNNNHHTGAVMYVYGQGATSKDAQLEKQEIEMRKKLEEMLLDLTKTEYEKSNIRAGKLTSMQQTEILNPKHSTSERKIEMHYSNHGGVDGRGDMQQQFEPDCQYGQEIDKMFDLQNKRGLYTEHQAENIYDPPNIQPARTTLHTVSTKETKETHSEYRQGNRHMRHAPNVSHNESGKTESNSDSSEESSSNENDEFKDNKKDGNFNNQEESRTDRYETDSQLNLGQENQSSSELQTEHEENDNLEYGKDNNDHREIKVDASTNNNQHTKGYFGHKKEDEKETNFNKRAKRNVYLKLNDKYNRNKRYSYSPYYTGQHHNHHVHHQHHFNHGDNVRYFGQHALVHPQNLDPYSTYEQGQVTEDDGQQNIEASFDNLNHHYQMPRHYINVGQQAEDDLGQEYVPNLSVHTEVHQTPFVYDNSGLGQQTEHDDFQQNIQPVFSDVDEFSQKDAENLYSNVGQLNQELNTFHLGQQTEDGVGQQHTESDFSAQLEHQRPYRFTDVGQETENEFGHQQTEAIFGSTNENQNAPNAYTDLEQQAENEFGKQNTEILFGSQDGSQHKPSADNEHGQKTENEFDTQSDFDSQTQQLQKQNEFVGVGQQEQTDNEFGQQNTGIIFVSQNQRKPKALSNMGQTTDNEFGQQNTETDFDGAAAQQYQKSDSFDEVGQQTDNEFGQQSTGIIFGNQNENQHKPNANAELGQQTTETDFDGQTQQLQKQDGYISMGQQTDNEFRQQNTGIIFGTQSESQHKPSALGQQSEDEFGQQNNDSKFDSQTQQLQKQNQYNIGVDHQTNNEFGQQTTGTGIQAENKSLPNAHTELGHQTENKFGQQETDSDVFQTQQLQKPDDFVGISQKTEDEYGQQNTERIIESLNEKQNKPNAYTNLGQQTENESDFDGQTQQLQKQDEFVGLGQQEQTDHEFGQQNTGIIFGSQNQRKPKALSNIGQTTNNEFGQQNTETDFDGQTQQLQKQDGFVGLGQQTDNEFGQQNTGIIFGSQNQNQRKPKAYAELGQQTESEYGQQNTESDFDGQIQQLQKQDGFVGLGQQTDNEFGQRNTGIIFGSQNQNQHKPNEYSELVQQTENEYGQQNTETDIDGQTQQLQKQDEFVGLGQQTENEFGQQNTGIIFGNQNENQYGELNQQSGTEFGQQTIETGFSKNEKHQKPDVGQQTSHDFDQQNTGTVFGQNNQRKLDNEFTDVGQQKDHDFGQENNNENPKNPPSSFNEKSQQKYKDMMEAVNNYAENLNPSSNSNESQEKSRKKETDGEKQINKGNIVQAFGIHPKDESKESEEADTAYSPSKGRKINRSEESDEIIDSTTLETSTKGYEPESQSFWGSLGGKLKTTYNTAKERLKDASTVVVGKVKQSISDLSES